MKYRPEIDGLRAIAVIPVILFHAGFSSFRGGFLGVDIFFVISGYLITSLVHADLSEGEFSLLKFYERRARRILPALFCVALACVPFAWALLLPRDLIGFSRSLVAVPPFASNILFWYESGYFDTSAELKPLLHTWSLAVEEQYYILFPLLMLSIWKFGRRWIIRILAILFVISLSLAQWWSYSYPEASFYLLPTRAWELLVGVFASFYFNTKETSKIGGSASNVLSLLGLIVIAGSVLAYTEETPHPTVYALAPTLGTLLIILFASEGTIVNLVLRNPFVAGLGLLSYSLYLWHFPVFAFFKYSSLLQPSQLEMSLLAILCVPIAYISWRFVEQPFRDRNIVSRKFLFFTSVACGLILVVTGLCFLMSDGAVRRRDAEVQRAISVQDGWRDQSSCIFKGITDPSNINRCIASFPDEKFVFLIGDSHADAISKMLRDKLSAHGIGLITWWYPACLPVRFTSRLPLANSSKKMCHQFKEQVFRFLESNTAPIVLIARWRLNIEGDRYDNGEGGIEIGRNDGLNAVSDGSSNSLTQHIEEQLKVLARRHSVAALSQIPEPGWNVPKKVVQVIDSGGDPRSVSTSYDRYQLLNKRVNSLLTQVSSFVTVIDAAELVCSRNTQRCLNVVNGIPLYRDEQHPSKIHGEILSEAIFNGFVKGALK
jgi:peptidoglycan/LPS O-acetylase OafA/YrhL